MSVAGVSTRVSSDGWHIFTVEITLEPSEFQRAATVDGHGAYFLAVVGGLEEGAETVLRIFAHPSRTLRWKRTSTIRLAGVRTARALRHPDRGEPTGESLS